jgi:hypothetical protein
MTAREPSTFTKIHVGRFSLDVPSRFERVAQAFSFARVALVEIPWPSPGAGGELWAGRLAEIRGLTAPPGEAEVVVEERDLRPGLRRVVYRSAEYNAERVADLALLDASPVGLWMELHGFVDLVAGMDDVILETASAYRLRQGEAPLPAGDWFHLERGIIAAPSLGRETAFVVFELLSPGPERRVTLEILTEETGGAADPGLLSRISGVLSRPHDELEIRILGSGARTVAGMEGEEARIGIDADGQRGVVFTYEHQEDAGGPGLTVKLTAGDEDLADRTALWDHILGSVKRRGA